MLPLCGCMFCVDVCFLECGPRGIAGSSTNSVLNTFAEQQQRYLWGRTGSDTTEAAQQQQQQRSDNFIISYFHQIMGPGETNQATEELP